MRHIIEDGVDIPMRDGCILKADIWRPDSDGSRPVLLQRTPYRREDVHGAQYISALEFQAALRRGYAVVVQDTRGRYASEGTFTPFSHEAEDGADTIAWLREQPFCDGRVAMFGCSYVGATQVLAATADPEGLVAIAPQLTTARHGASWIWRGGALELGFVLLWVIEALGAPDLERRTDVLGSEAKERLRSCLARLQSDPAAAFEALPLSDPDLLEMAGYLADWFDATRAANSEANREHLDHLLASRPAMLVTAGSNDIFFEGSLELFQTARARGRDQDRLIIGPWSHGNPKDWQGDFWHGYAASTALLSEATLDYFDAVLAGTNELPVVRYFRTGSDTWHEAPDWPIPNTDQRTFHLAGSGLVPDPPSEDQPRVFVSDPRNPVPTVGGATFLPGLLTGTNSGAKDQRKVESRSDVLVYTSDALEAALEVTGQVSTCLNVATDAPSADWTVRLCEVFESGQSIGLVDGIRRVAAADGSTVEVTLGTISHLFRRGSRIRLQIAGSNFPRFDRNPQSGVAPAIATVQDMRSARRTVFGGTLNLPSIPVSYPQRPQLI